MHTVKYSYFKTYLLANKIILFVILLISIYPLIVEFTNYSIICQYKQIYAQDCRSCGLTRGLKSCFKGDFAKAKELNIQSLYIFNIIILQIFMRLTIVLFPQWIFNMYKFRFQIILIIDIILTTGIVICDIVFY